MPPHATKAFTAQRSSILLHCWPAIPASAFWNSAARASMRNIDLNASSSFCGAAFGSTPKHHCIDVLIGCASLPGVDPLALALPLSFLHRHALADEEWRVRPLAGRGVDMAVLGCKAIEARKGVAASPPLLKA